MFAAARTIGLTFLDLMTKFFRWELDLPEQDFLVPDWQDRRAGDNLESVYWLYNRTGDEELLNLARVLKTQSFDWNRHFAERIFFKAGVHWRLSAVSGELESAMSTFFLTVISCTVRSGKIRHPAGTRP